MMAETSTGMRRDDQDRTKYEFNLVKMLESLGIDNVHIDWKRKRVILPEVDWRKVAESTGYKILRGVVVFKDLGWWWVMAESESCKQRSEWTETAQGYDP
jgi:hypothetical protein